MIRLVLLLAVMGHVACASFSEAEGGAVGPDDAMPDPSEAVSVPAEVDERVDDLKRLRVEATEIGDGIHKIDGQGAIFLVDSDAGSILIDTGFDGPQSQAQKALVLERASGPVEKIVLTHSHPDHAGGLVAWQDELASGTELVAHERYGYMSRLQSEPLPYLKRRFHVLYPDLVDLEAEEDRLYWEMRPTRPVFPGSDHVFELGGERFEVIALENTGEGEDGLMIWLPDREILFVGDLFGTLFPMFPNLYTVRGEKPRDPLDYVDALDRVLELDPQVLVPSHFHVIRGREVIRANVRRMRDAVQYVWDQTIAGMNSGRTLWELMAEIELPEPLRLSQGHGKVSWAVRTIWELVVGWYDYETVANLYAVPPSAVHADLVDLAGGADAIAARARTHLASGRPLEALRLLDVADARPTTAVLETRVDVLEVLLAQARGGARNYSEIGLLEADLRRSKAGLAALAGSGPPSRR